MGWLTLIPILLQLASTIRIWGLHMTSRTSLSLPAAAALLALQAMPVSSAVSSYSLAVDVTLSPKAAALLSSRHEAVTVMTNYYGDPVPSKMYLDSPEGGIGIGTEFITIAGAGRATITGTKVMAERVDWVKSIMVLINVVSARRSDRNNLLDCGIFEDTLAKARERLIAIFCRVIGER